MLVFCFLSIFLLLIFTSNCCQISKKYFICARHWNGPILHENTPSTVCFSLISLKECIMSQSLFHNIDYSGRRRPFLFRKLQWEQNTKYVYRITVTFINFKYNNISLRWLSIASSTCHFDYSYASIYALKLVYSYVCQVSTMAIFTSL